MRLRCAGEGHRLAPVRPEACRTSYPALRCSIVSSAEIRSKRYSAARPSSSAGNGGETTEEDDHVAAGRQELLRLRVERVVAGPREHREPPGKQRRCGCDADADAAGAHDVEQPPASPVREAGAAATIALLLGEMRSE